MKDKEAKPGNYVDSLIADLDNKSGFVRQEARCALVQLGEKAIEPLSRHVNADSHLLRWEVVKTLGQIEDIQAAPALIEALEDDEFDIRWLGAEGLVRLGPDSLRPLLVALSEKADSVFVREGAHHVLYDLKDRLSDKKEEVDILMDHLRSGATAEDVPVLVDKILQKL